MSPFRKLVMAYQLMVLLSLQSKGNQTPDWLQPILDAPPDKTSVRHSGTKDMTKKTLGNDLCVQVCDPKRILQQKVFDSKCIRLFSSWLSLQQPHPLMSSFQSRPRWLLLLRPETQETQMELLEKPREDHFKWLFLQTLTREKLQSQFEGHKPHTVTLCIRAEDFKVEKDKAGDYALLGYFPSPSKTSLHLSCNLTQPKELWSHELILSLLK